MSVTYLQSLTFYAQPQEERSGSVSADHLIGIVLDSTAIMAHLSQTEWTAVEASVAVLGGTLGHLPDLQGWRVVWLQPST